MNEQEGTAPASFIRDVWADNLESEFAVIREVIVNYPYVSMDTEFPGVVARPIGNFKSSSDFHYQSVRCNVDLLKIIQLGLTLCNEDGELAPNVCTYQFNFQFSLNDDIYAQDSIDLLTRSGIDFNRHEEGGIEPTHFAELLMCSGIVLCDEVRWITFHSGYDFAYIMKLLTCKPLPIEEEDFFAELLLFCPHIYDIKHMMRSCENLKGGLTKLAEELEVERIGPEHQAGSDSLLTQATFFKMRSLFFENEIDDSKYDNVLYGFGRGAPSSKAVAHEAESRFASQAPAESY